MTEQDFSKERLIEHLRDILPVVCTTRNLIDIGMYRDTAVACVARKRESGPKSVYVPDRGYVYDREEVIQYLIHNEKKKCSKAVRKQAGFPVQWSSVIKESATRKCYTLSRSSRKKVLHPPG